MAPKKKEQQQKMSLGDFLTDGFGGGSWADEVEETYVAGTQPLPASDRPRVGGAASAWQDRGFSIRESVPQRLPDRPPFTAHLGNLSYEATSESVTEFFEGCGIVSVRIIEDRELMRPKGFGYVEFTDLDGLKKALDLDGESFQGRMIKIKIADPPRGGDMRGDSSRDLSDWTRKGPLPDLPGRQRQPSDFGGERRMRDPALEARPAREMNWERRGPLAPLSPQEGGPGSRDASRSRPGPEGLGERSESFRGPRPDRADRPDRPERPERVDRTPTAAEKDMQWRDRMRPDASKNEGPSQDGSEAPSSPAPAAAAPVSAPAMRPKLNLQKRTVTETTDSAAAGGDSKASPFGAARPIDTAARERQVEEKRQQAIQEKREADEKAKEERRLAKQAAKEAEAEAEAKENETETGDAEKTDAAAKPEESAEATEATEATKETAEANETQNGASSEAKAAARPREPREPKDNVSNYKSRAGETGSWRSASNETRGPRGGARGGRGGGPGRGGRNENRGPRANGNGAPAPAQQAAGGDSEPATVDEDGWTTVPKKGRQGGRP